MSFADGGDEFGIVLDGTGVNPRHRRQCFDRVERMPQVVVDSHDGRDSPQVVVTEAIHADRMKSRSDGTGRRGASAGSDDQQLGL